MHMKNLKRTFILLLSLLLFSPLFPITAKAALDAPKLQELGSKMVDKRVTSLNSYDKLLVQAKHISQEIIADVRNDIASTNGNLEALKNKIMSEVDLPALKTDIKSIVDDYRVYQVFLPQSSGIIACDRLSAFYAKLDELKTKISQKANELETTGKDVSKVRELLSAADNSLNSGKEYISAAQNKFSSMSISDPEGSRVLKLDGRSALLDAKKVSLDARNNLQQAISQIKELVK